MVNKDAHAKRFMALALAMMIGMVVGDVIALAKVTAEPVPRMISIFLTMPIIIYGFCVLTIIGGED